MRRGAAAALLLGAAVLALRCGSDGKAALDRVEPSSGPNDQPIAITIHGRSLAPTLGVDVGCNGKAVADTQFYGALGTQALVSLVWQSESVLAAVVPAGMTPGEYDLSLHAPDGQTLLLPRAYRVLGPGGADAGGNCETLYATGQQLLGPSLNEIDDAEALLAPDGSSASVRGQFSGMDDSWIFLLPGSTRTGAVTADVSLFFFVGGNYIDDRFSLDVSGDGGATWQTALLYDPVGGGAAPPRAPATVGPLPTGAVTTAPTAAGQAQVRLHSAGASGPRDTFELHVDAVALRLCQ